MHDEPPRLNPWKLFVGSMVPNWLMERREISLGAKLTYARLCQYAGRHGFAYPTQVELAQALGVVERQARRYLKELSEQELITVHRTGLRKSNRITFNLHPWMAGPSDVDRLWKNPPDRTDVSGQKRTDMSGPIGRESVEENQKTLRSRSRGRGSRRNAPGKTIALVTPGEKAPDVTNLTLALGTALQMGDDDEAAARSQDAQSEAAGVRHAIEMLGADERSKLDAFVGWVGKQGASSEEQLAIVSELLANPEIANPYAYFAQGSEARERIRRRFA